MKRIIRYALIGIGSAILLLGGMFVWFRWWIFTPSIEQSNGPASREIAIKHIKHDLLPPSAQHIQYSFSVYQVSPAFESFIRYEAPASDCIAIAKSQFPKIQLKPLGKDERNHQQDSTMGKNVDWFDPNHITRGLIGGKGYEGEPEIWIDEERGVFYYYLTD